MSQRRSTARQTSKRRYQTADHFFFDDYWTFLAQKGRYAGVARPVLRWTPHAPQLNQLERKYFDFLAPCRSVLEIGAGTLELKRKIEAAGFKGEYRVASIATPFARSTSRIGSGR